MLLELYMGLFLLNVIVFGIAFFKKSVWFWAMSLVLSGLLIFASFNIEQQTTVVTSQTAVGATVTFTYEIITKSTNDQAMFGLTLGMFLLGLALFLNDLFISFKEAKLGERKY